MESGKVMFEVVNVNENVPDDEHPDEDDDIAFRREDISGKKSSLILRRIPRKLSKQRLGDVGQYDRETQKEIEARRKTLFASRSDLSRVSSVFLAETKSRQSRGSNIKSIGMSGRGSSRILFSDNIPVRSMTLEMPRRTALPEEEAAVYCDILEKSLDQLELIRYRIPAEVDDRWDEGDRNCCEKYDVPAEPEYNLREYLGLRTLIPSVSEKLQRDRTYIYNVLRELTDELRISGRYDRLELEIERIARVVEEEHNLEVNHEIWSEQAEQLRLLMKSEKLDNEINVKKLMSQVHDSAADIDDTIFRSKSKLGYVRRWESARLEGQRLQLEQREHKFQDQLSDCERWEGVEEVVSEEIMAYLQQDIERLEKDYREWMNIFNDEVDQLDEEIEYKKQDIEEAEKKVGEMSRLSEQRKRFIDDCVERRRIAAEVKAYSDAVNQAARLIQAHWKGHMVRHQLGPYRGLWKALKKRKKLAAKRRKKIENRRMMLEQKQAEEAKKKK